MINAKSIKRVDLQGFQIEETFVKNQDGSWTRTDVQINGQTYCPYCFGFLDSEDTCKSCEMKNDESRTISQKEIDERLEDEVNFF